MTSETIHAGDGLPLTIPALWRARVAARGPATLLTCDDTVLSYEQADARSAGLARGLLALGAGRGTHVGLLHPNGDEFVVAWLAAARIGAVAVPLSTFSTSGELQAQLRGADVEVLVSANAYRSHDYVERVGAAVGDLDLARPPPAWAPSVPALRYVAFAEPGPGIDAAWSTDAVIDAGSEVGPDVLRAAEDGVEASDRLVIVHTSGSTSEPKGVIHTHGALIRHIDNLNELRRYTADEVLFSTSPFFWIGGFAYSLLGTIVAGAHLVCSNGTVAGAVLDLLERARPTMVNGFAASVAHLAGDPSYASRDLTSIRRGNLYPIMPAAARPRDPELHHDMLGMTEAGSVCLASADESEQPERRRGSFGCPVPGFEARVVGEEDGVACGPNQVGELHLRGPFMMEGYYGRERHEVFDIDGWFHTGDLFAVDEDGFYYFRGRRGDMIKTAGANVSPREVEKAILEVTGLTAHVLGLDDPDRGQVVAAVVVVTEGRSTGPDELRAQLTGQLSSYKVPRRIVTVAEGAIPMMSSGKVDARALKGLFDG